MHNVLYAWYNGKILGFQDLKRWVDNGSLTFSTPRLGSRCFETRKHPRILSFFNTEPKDESPEQSLHSIHDIVTNK